MVLKLIFRQKSIHCSCMNNSSNESDFEWVLGAIKHYELDIKKIIIWSTYCDWLVCNNSDARHNIVNLVLKCVCAPQYTTYIMYFQWLVSWKPRSKKHYMSALSPELTQPKHHKRLSVWEWGHEGHDANSTHMMFSISTAWNEESSHDSPVRLTLHFNYLLQRSSYPGT